MILRCKTEWEGFKAGEIYKFDFTERRDAEEALESRHFDLIPVEDHIFPDVAVTKWPKTEIRIK